MTHTLLLGVDDSPASARAVEMLAGYRGDRGAARVVVANIQHRPVAIWPEASIDVRAIESALLDEGREIAAHAAERLKAAGYEAEPLVRLGIAADGLVREARAQGAGMIVLGTRGHGALHGFAFGSVAMRVAHASPVPVCLVQPQSALPAQLGRRLRVMLAVDGSPAALRAAAAVAAWRGWLGELDVQMVYVQAPLPYLATVLPPHDDVIGQWSSRAGEEATQPARDFLSKAGIEHHLHLSMGDPAREIVHLADETHCEMLVLGTRGLGAAHHALIGSVALKAAAHAAMPVMLVGHSKGVMEP